LGAFSKEFWITVAICIPVILWTLNTVQSRGQDIRIPALQIATLVVGGLVIWKMGGRIVEAVTRVWERLELTRAWDSGEAAEGISRESVETDDPTRHATGAKCVECGKTIAIHAEFCRWCGSKQPKR